MVGEGELHALGEGEGIVVVVEVVALELALEEEEGWVVAFGVEVEGEHHAWGQIVFQVEILVPQKEGLLVGACAQGNLDSVLSDPFPFFVLIALQQQHCWEKWTFHLLRDAA